MPGNLGTMLVKLRADTTQFHTGMSAAGKSIGALRSGMMALSGVAAALGGTLTAIGVKSIKTAANFEAGMARVGAVSQASASDLQAMKASALSLAAGSKFTAVQVSEAMKFMAMAGMQTKNILGGIPAVLDLAAAGAIDLGSASDIVTNIMAGFGKKAEELGSSVDTVVTAITSANVDVAQLGHSFKYVGPVASAAGISFEETAAAIALLGNAGIQGSMAGTTLRSALSRLLNPTNEIKEAIKGLGVNLYNTDGSLISLTEMLYRLKPHANDAGRILQIFGDRAGPGMSALLSQGGDAIAALTFKMRENADIAKRIAAAEMKTFAGQLMILESQFERVQITIGQALMPVARELLGWASKLANWFGSLSDSTKKMIFGLGAASTAAGALVTAFAMLWPAVTPLAIIVGAIAGIVLYVNLLRKAWESDFGYIKTITLGLWDAFEWVFNKILGGVTWVIDAHLKLFRFLADGLRTLTGGKIDLEVTTSSAEEILSDLKNDIGEAAELAAGAAKDGMKKAGAALVDTLAEGAVTIKNTLGGIFSGVLGILPKSGGIGSGGGTTAAIAPTDYTGGRGLPASGANAVLQFGELDWNMIEGEFQTELKKVDLAGIFSKPFGKAAAALDFTAGIEEIKARGEDLALGFADAASTVNIAFDALAGAASTAASTYLQSQVDAGRMTKEAASKMTASTQSATDVMSAAVDGFAKGGMVGGVVGALSSLFSKSAAFGKVTAKLGVLFSGLMKALEPIFNTLATALAPVFDSLQYLLAPIALLGSVLIVLVPIFKLVSKIFIVVGKVLGIFAGVIASVWNFLLDIVAGIVGIFSKSSARDIRKQKIDVNASLAEEDNTTATEDNTAAIEDSTDNVNDFSNTVAEVNEELGNVPDAFKIANARYNAMDATTPSLVAGEGAGGVGAFNGATIILQTQDVDDAMDKLDAAAERRSFAASGSTVTRGVAGTFVGSGLEHVR